VFFRAGYPVCLAVPGISACWAKIRAFPGATVQTPEHPPKSPSAVIRVPPYVIHESERHFGRREHVWRERRQADCVSQSGAQIKASLKKRAIQAQPRKSFTPAKPERNDLLAAQGFA